MHCGEVIVGEQQRSRPKERFWQKRNLSNENVAGKRELRCQRNRQETGVLVPGRDKNFTLKHSDEMGNVVRVFISIFQIFKIGSNFEYFISF